MRRILAFLVLSTAGLSVYAETPECKYWNSHLIELNDKIQKNDSDLRACQSVPQNNCHDLEVLAASLQDEKATTEQFIKDFCK